MPGRKIVLYVKGLGSVPSFKNKKKIIQLKINGKLRPSLMTDPKKAKWMERCIQDFASQLSSSSVIEGVATFLGCSKQSAIALSMPADDCWAELELGFAQVQMVEAGLEGACIILTKNEDTEKEKG